MLHRQAVGRWGAPHSRRRLSPPFAASSANFITAFETSAFPCFPNDSAIPRSIASLAPPVAASLSASILGLEPDPAPGTCVTFLSDSAAISLASASVSVLPCPGDGCRGSVIPAGVGGAAGGVAGFGGVAGGVAGFGGVAGGVAEALHDCMLHACKSTATATPDNQAPLDRRAPHNALQHFISGDWLWNCGDGGPTPRRIFRFVQARLRVFLFSLCRAVPSQESLLFQLRDMAELGMAGLAPFSPFDGPGRRPMDDPVNVAENIIAWQQQAAIHQPPLIEARRGDGLGVDSPVEQSPANSGPSKELAHNKWRSAQSHGAVEKPSRDDGAQPVPRMSLPTTEQVGRNGELRRRLDQQQQVIALQNRRIAEMERKLARMSTDLNDPESEEMRSMRARRDQLYAVIGKQAGELQTMQEARMGAEYQAAAARDDLHRSHASGRAAAGGEPCPPGIIGDDAHLRTANSSLQRRCLPCHPARYLHVYW